MPQIPAHASRAPLNQIGRVRFPGVSRRMRCAVFTIGLAATLGLVGFAESAKAVCTPTPDPLVATGTVLCTGTSTGFEVPVGVDDVTITVDGTAVLDDTDGAIEAAVGANDDSTIEVEAGATITVMDLDGVGVSTGNNGTVNVADGAIFDVLGENGIGVRVGADSAVDFLGTVNVDGVGARGLELGVGSTLTGVMTGRIIVNGTGGVGIFGAGDNAMGFGGTIDVEVLGGRAIRNQGVSMDMGTTARTAIGPLGVINLNADDAVGFESAGDETFALFGTTTINGADGTAVLYGDRMVPTKGNFIQIGSVNPGEGTINIGDGTAATSRGIGVSVGDGWFPNDVDGVITEPDFTESELGNGIIAVFGGGTINVNSIDGFGIRAGTDGNGLPDNSVALNAGTINVLAPGAIGLSLGGNDFARPADGSGIAIPFSFRNDGMLMGTGMHGALVEFRTTSTGENRIVNSVGASLLADVSGTGSGIAIMGTDGVERVDNGGELRGDIFLRGGNDYFEVAGSGTYEGTIDGGAGGVDTFILRDTFSTGNVFDVSQLMEFEMIRIAGADGGSLMNAGGFSGTTVVEAGGRLVVPDPLTLGGDLLVDPSGTLELTIDPNAAVLTVMEDATLTGSTLRINADPSVASGTVTMLPLIDVVGTRAGEFGAVSAASLGLRAMATYVGDDVFVTIDRLSGNRGAIGGHLGAIAADGGATGELADLIDTLTNSTNPVGVTYDALSPIAYDAQTSVVVEGGRQITRLLFDRPRECQPGEHEPWTGLATPLPCHARKWSPWVATTGTFRSRDKYVGNPRYDARLGGIVAGIDTRPISGLDLTFAISSQRGSVDVANAGSSTLTLTDVSGHAAYSYGPLRVQGAVSWGHGFHRDRRLIEFPMPNGRPTSVRGREEHDSDRISLSGEASLQVDTGPIKLEPIVTVDWAWVYQEVISERAAGLLGLQVRERDDNIGSISAGLRASTTYHHSAYIAHQLDWMDGVWRPQVDVRWREVLTGAEREISARLVGAPAAVPNFRIEGQEDDGGFEIGAALSFVPKEADRLQFDLRYEAFVASHTLEQDLSFRIQLGF